MPIRPSSPSDMMTALLGIEKQYQSGDMFDNLYKMAATLEKLDSLEKNKLKYGTPVIPGTPGKPAVTETVRKSARPNIGAGRETYGIPGLEMLDNSSGIYPGLLLQPNLGLRGSTAFTTPEASFLTREVSPAVPAKPGTPGTLGTEELEFRKALLPFVATVGKSPEQTQQDVLTILTEPDRNKALQSVGFTPKNIEGQVAVTQEVADMFRNVGYNLIPGSLISTGDFTRIMQAARLKLSQRADSRAALKATEDLKIKKAKAKEAEEDAKLSEYINNVLGKETGSSNSGTTKSGNTFKILSR